jgi:hypothetical protein
MQKNRIRWAVAGQEGIEDKACGTLARKRPIGGPWMDKLSFVLWIDVDLPGHRPFVHEILRSSLRA